MDTLTRLEWTLGDRLAKARIVAGLSREDMASALGVAPRTITNYEHDNTKPIAAVLEVWSNRTGAPLDWLLGITECYAGSGYPGVLVGAAA